MEILFVIKNKKEYKYTLDYIKNKGFSFAFKEVEQKLDKYRDIRRKYKNKLGSFCICVEIKLGTFYLTSRKYSLLDNIVVIYAKHFFTKDGQKFIEDSFNLLEK